MDNPQASVTEFQIGWLLGILDGEGHIGFQVCTGNRYQPYIKFVNTNECINDGIEVVLRRLGQTLTIYDAYRAPNQRPAKRIEINGMLRVKSFLDRIHKYDFAKREEAMAMRDFIDLRLGQKKGSPYTEMELSLIEKVRSKTRR